MSGLFYFPLLWRGQGEVPPGLCASLYFSVHSVVPAVFLPLSHRDCDKVTRRSSSVNVPWIEPFAVASIGSMARFAFTHPTHALSCRPRLGRERHLMHLTMNDRTNHFANFPKCPEFEISRLLLFNSETKDIGSK
jgi:hypothetical protein